MFENLMFMGPVHHHNILVYNPSKMHKSRVYFI